MVLNKQRERSSVSANCRTATLDWQVSWFHQVRPVGRGFASGLQEVQFDALRKG